MSELKILKRGDEPALEAFLLPRIESSMFLIGNSRTSGLEDQGKPYEGTYAAVFEGNRISAVAAHYWSQVVVFQAPDHIEKLVRRLSSVSCRPLKGLLGPADQVEIARSALGLDDEDIQLDSIEHLYSLNLNRLRVPEILASGKTRGRPIEADDIELVTKWETAYSMEALGEAESSELRSHCLETVERSVQEKRAWILECNGLPVARAAFNAVLTEAVQVGGVWTPPALRNRGYARAVVAHSLLDAKRKGVSTAILFTPEGNYPAQKAYNALGFRRIGNYRLLFLKSPMEFFPFSAGHSDQ